MQAAAWPFCQSATRPLRLALPGPAGLSSTDRKSLCHFPGGDETSSGTASTARGWDQPGWGRTSAWAKPQLHCQSHSWIPRVTASASGRGMGALGGAEEKLLKCAGDKMGGRAKGQEQGQAGGNPRALSQGLCGGTRGPPHQGSSCQEQWCQEARFAQGRGPSLSSNIAVPTELEPEPSGTCLHPRLASALVSQELAGGAQSRRAHGPGVAPGQGCWLHAAPGCWGGGRSC